MEQYKKAGFKMVNLLISMIVCIIILKMDQFLFKIMNRLS